MAGETQCLANAGGEEKKTVFKSSRDRQRSESESEAANRQTNRVKEKRTSDE